MSNPYQTWDNSGQEHPASSDDDEAEQCCVSCCPRGEVVHCGTREDVDGGQLPIVKTVKALCLGTSNVIAGRRQRAAETGKRMASHDNERRSSPSVSRDEMHEVTYKEEKDHLETTKPSRKREIEVPQKRTPINQTRSEDNLRRLKTEVMQRHQNVSQKSNVVPLSPHQTNSLVLRKQAHVILALRKQLEKSKAAEENSRKEAEMARGQAVEARTLSDNLFRMLDNPVVKRNSRGRTEYPNGDGLQIKIRDFLQDAEDFFFDLADRVPMHKVHHSHNIHRLILSSVFMPVAATALWRAKEFVDRKYSNLLQLIGDGDLLWQNELVRLFWLSSMQKLVSLTVRSQDPIEMSEDHKTYFDSLTREILCWASLPEIRKHEDMEGRHIGTFARDLVHMQLLCEFSDPPCFLHPSIGEQVTFDPCHHTVKHLSSRQNRKALPGEKVHVIYPGLYFAPPNTKERDGSLVTPTVKALVAYF